MVKVVAEFSGVMYDKTARTERPVLLKVSGTVIQVDDPPIIPPPSDAHPEHPIFYPPVPSHPIVLPDPPPTEPPVDPPTNPSDPNWVWGFVPDGSGGGSWKPVFVPGEGQGGPHR